jgi:hypothetical protein
LPPQRAAQRAKQREAPGEGAAAALSAAPASPGFTRLRYRYDMKRRCEALRQHASAARHARRMLTMSIYAADIFRFTILMIFGCRVDIIFIAYAAIIAAFTLFLSHYFQAFLSHYYAEYFEMSFISFISLFSLSC